MSEVYAARVERLRALLRDLGSALVALSGGLDSSVLAAAARRELKDAAAAITAVGPLFPADEAIEAAALCRGLDLAHGVLEHDPLDTPAFRDNPLDRCYHCKLGLMSALQGRAAESGLAWVCEGTCVDDLAEHRPGLIALRELGVRSPLLEAGLTKADVRRLALELGLPRPDRRSTTCLATRFPHGSAVTRAGLAQVAGCEAALSALGLGELRVRHHGTMARIEIAQSELQRALEPALRERIVAAIRGQGFEFATLDLEGFCSGRMSAAAQKAGQTL